MIALAHQVRSARSGGLYLVAPAGDHTHGELPYDHRQTAQRPDDLCADDMLSGAAFDRQLLGCQVNTDAALVVFDGADAIDVNFWSHDGLYEIGDRRDDPSTHLLAPQSCNERGEHALHGTFGQRKYLQPAAVTIGRKNSGNCRNRQGTRNYAFAIQSSRFAFGSSPLTKQTAIFPIRFNAASAEHRKIATHVSLPLNSAIDTAPSSALVAVEEKNSWGCGITETSSELVAA